MDLIARFANQAPGKLKMTRDELVSLIRGQSNLMDDSEDIIRYIDSLKEVKGVTEQTIRAGYLLFKADKDAKDLADIAQRHSLTTAALQTFVAGILDRMIFDADQLGDLFVPLDLGWKARAQAESALMADLHPLLTKRAQGRDISGLSAYEQ
jgi:type I restriction enzyme, R subunit